MLVYLFRHGEALPETVDPNRPLSSKGEAEVVDTTAFFLADGVKVDEIWHSTKLRAKQTAEIVARMLNVKRVVEMDGLKPDDDPAPIANLIRQAQDASVAAQRNRTPDNAPHAILIAGHLPFLPKLAALLDPQRGKVELGTGEAARVDL